MAPGRESAPNEAINAGRKMAVAEEAATFGQEQPRNEDARGETNEGGCAARREAAGPTPNIRVVPNAWGLALTSVGTRRHLRVVGRRLFDETGIGQSEFHEWSFYDQTASGSGKSMKLREAREKVALQIICGSNFRISRHPNTWRHARSVLDE